MSCFCLITMPAPGHQPSHLGASGSSSWRCICGLGGIERSGVWGYRLLTVTSLGKWLPSANIQLARVKARMLRPADWLEKLLAMGLVLVG